MSDKNKNKVALITGASRGLGRYLATHFAKKDIKVAAIARSKDKLESLKEEIKKSGGEIEVFAVNVTDYQKLEKTIKHIKKKWNRIDILVNNAGIDIVKPLEELSQEDIDNVIDIDLKGPIYTTRLVAPIMMESRGTKYIFNISSMAGTRSLNNNGLYHASKFGVNGFGNSMSKYLMKHDIHVITLCPGGINTSWYDKHEWKFDRKTLIEPYEIAELIEFIMKSRNTTLYQKIFFFPASVAERW